VEAPRPGGVTGGAHAAETTVGARRSRHPRAEGTTRPPLRQGNTSSPGGATRRRRGSMSSRGETTRRHHDSMSSRGETTRRCRGSTSNPGGETTRRHRGSTSSPGGGTPRRRRGSTSSPGGGTTRRCRHGSTSTRGGTTRRHRGNASSRGGAALRRRGSTSSRGETTHLHRGSMTSQGQRRAETPASPPAAGSMRRLHVQRSKHPFGTVTAVAPLRPGGNLRVGRITDARAPGTLRRLRLLAGRTAVPVARASVVVAVAGESRKGTATTRRTDTATVTAAVTGIVGLRPIGGSRLTAGDLTLTVGLTGAVHVRTTALM